MPFDSGDDVAERVPGTSKLSQRKRRQWMHVFNKCYEDNGDDSSCYAKAWGAVNNTACLRCSSEFKLARELMLIANDLHAEDAGTCR